MSSQDEKERVRDANDIVDIVSGFVNLKQTGKNFKGLCPFHKEKTPSFIVSPDRQTFKCFGCGVGGDVFEFLMKAEGKTFSEALRSLAKRAHIELDGHAKPAVDAEADKLKRQLLAVMQWATERFQQALGQPKTGKSCSDYLGKRKVSKELQSSFQLGYAPSGWENLLRAAKRDHFSEELLEKAGLIVVRPEDQKRYDRFRNRLMFPIFDLNSRPVAFGGRMLGPGEPKYLNSPETPVFHKGGMLYALDRARDAARHAKRFVLVEGYMDVIACHGAGVAESVATLGTALTPDQARLLKRYAPDVLLLYDMDDAGMAASVRAFEILHQAGMGVKIATLPGAKDPDEYIRKKGKEAFSQRLNEGVSMAAFVLDAACRKHDTSTVEGKIAVIKETGQIIVQYPKAGAEYGEYAHMVAERLHLGDSQVQYEINRLIKKNITRNKPETEDDSEQEESILIKKKAVEEELIAATLLQHPAMVEGFRSALDMRFFKTQEIKKIIQAILDAPVADPEEPEAWQVQFREGLKRDLAPLAEQLANDGMETDEPKKVLHDCLSKLKMAFLQERLSAIQIRIKDVEKTGDMETLKQLAQEKRDVAAELNACGVVWKGGLS